MSWFWYWLYVLSVEGDWKWRFVKTVQDLRKLFKFLWRLFRIHEDCSDLWRLFRIYEDCSSFYEDCSELMKTVLSCEDCSELMKTVPGFVKTVQNLWRLFSFCEDCSEFMKTVLFLWRLFKDAVQTVLSFLKTVPSKQLEDNSKQLVKTLQTVYRNPKLIKTVKKTGVQS